MAQVIPSPGTQPWEIFNPDYQLTSQKNQPGGYAGLTAAGKLFLAQVPNLPENTITNLVADLAALQLRSEKNQPNGYAGIGGDGFIPENLIGRPRWVNAARFGYVGDGVADDQPAIMAALNSLPVYVSGTGGGGVFLPPTAANTCKLGAAITLAAGQTLMGGGQHQPLMDSTLVGPTVLVPAGADFCHLENVLVRNQSTNVAAQALSVASNTHFSATRCQFNCWTTGAGSCISLFDSALMVTLDDCEWGGFGTTNVDHAIIARNSSNVFRVVGGSIRDTKGGVLARSMHGLYLGDLIQFEALGSTGTAADTFYGVIALTDVRGGQITGNYFEANGNQPIIQGFAAAGASRGLLIGGHYIENSGSAAVGTINLGSITHSRVTPNASYPGASAPNANLVVNSSVAADARTNVIDQQYLASGTGLPITPNVFDSTGSGTPEGVVTAAPGSTFHRTDGGAVTSFYVKETGTGNTGWVAK